MHAGWTDTDVSPRVGTRNCSPPGAQLAPGLTTWQSGGVNDLDDLISDWLTLPDVAHRLDLEITQVRRLIDDGRLVDVRRGDPEVRSVPALLLLDGEIAPYLGGTIAVLRDGGFTDEELLAWLFTEDPTLPGRPIDHLRAGQRGEVRRRAQALAF